MCFKKNSLNIAFDNGLRHCPICKSQLVWKSKSEQPQKNLATVDHIIPRSIGGADTPGNIFVMCRQCNGKRGADCFVEYLTDAGISASYAENLYKQAHISTLQCMIYTQFTNSFTEQKIANRTNRKRRKQVRRVIKNYTEYFGDYLPEFELLEKLL